MSIGGNSTELFAVVDDLIAEYLLFRGFSTTLKSLEMDRKAEKDCKYRVDCVVEAVVVAIEAYDVEGLNRIWDFLHTKVFNGLDKEQIKVAKALEADTHRLYLVNCIRHKEKAKCSDFLERMSDRIQQMSDWFALPFVADASADDKFRDYFTRQWQERLLVSLNNLVAIALAANVRTPKLAACVRAFARLSAASATNAANNQASNASDGRLALSASDDPILDDFAIIAQRDQSLCSSTMKKNQSKSSLKNILRSIAGKKGSA